MERLTEIYEDMARSGIFLSSGSYHLKGDCDSIVVRDGENFGVFLDIDKIRTIVQEKEAVSHEWAHILTGTTYSFDDPPEVKARAENRADKRQIRLLIAENELLDAISDGYTEIWELAERFNVSEDLMRKALHLYEYGYLE